jgi:hypothetical protein
MLHVVFNSSAAAGLRDALRQAGRDERVVGSPDSLSFGPINPSEPELRRKWVEEELGYTGWDNIGDEMTSFWREAVSDRHRRVAWLSRRSAQEYAGFLEWLWRLDEEPIEVIDLTDVVVTGNVNGAAGSHLAVSLGLLSPNKILEGDLLGRAETLTPVSRARYRELWGRLRAENAPLRVLSEGELVSAPLSFFDQLLVSCTQPEWQRAARVIGEALVQSSDSVLQTGDLVLCARVRALAGTGLLEFRGDLSDIYRGELRLPISRDHPGHHSAGSI